jgi:hypothetical protein
MKNKTSEQEFLFFSQLRRGGIPLDEEVLEGMKAASCGLSIHDTGTIVDSAVFDLAFGGTGYMLSIAILNDANRIIRPREFRLAMVWDEPQFRWLEDPLRKVPRQFTYEFPSHGPVGFEREVVLNHRLGAKGRLNPGDCLDGFLLGVGQRPIPGAYSDRQILRTRLSVVDDRGDCYESRVKLLVRREEQLMRRQATVKLRGAGDRHSEDNQPRIVPTRKRAA